MKYDVWQGTVLFAVLGDMDKIENIKGEGLYFDSGIDIICVNR